MSKKTPRTAKTPGRGVSMIFLIVGFITSAMAIDYENFLGVLIGVTMIFWGGLIYYITPNIYVKKSILENTSEDLQKSLNQLTSEYKGHPLYISPNTVWGLTNCLLFIPKTDTSETPSDETLTGETMLTEGPSGFKMLAPGSGLSKSFEEILGTTFSSNDLQYLADNIRGVLVDELEMVKDIRTTYEFSKVNIIIRGSVFHNITDEKDRLMGDPLISALSCSVSKATRKPVRIENIVKKDREKSIILTLRIID